MNKIERPPTPDSPDRTTGQCRQSREADKAAPARRSREPDAASWCSAYCCCWPAALGIGFWQHYSLQRASDGDGRAAPRLRAERADGAGARQRQHHVGELARHDRGLRAGQYLRPRQRLYLQAQRRYRQPSQSRATAGGDHRARARSSDRAGGGNARADAGLAAAGQGQSRSRPSHLGPRQPAGAKRLGHRRNKAIPIA